MRVAVRYAVAREELEKDPFRNIGEAAEISKEKGVLTPDEAARLITAPITDPRHRLAVLLGVLCGMRIGEVRGLLWEDINQEEKIITIRNNYIDGEGMKAPKCKGGTARKNSRTVPLPSSVAVILETFQSLNPAPDSFVFESFQLKGEPVSKGFFRYVIDKELTAIDIPGVWKEKGPAPVDYVNEQKKRNLTFHSLRHTFITLGRLAGITDLEIQALAGHKSGAIMEKYSHAAQVLDFTAAREKLERAVGV
jgi:integrase